MVTGRGFLLPISGQGFRQARLFATAGDPARVGRMFSVVGRRRRGDPFLTLAFASLALAVLRATRAAAATPAATAAAAARLVAIGRLAGGFDLVFVAAIFLVVVVIAGGLVEDGGRCGNCR